MSPVQRANQGFSIAFCWQDIGFMAAILVSLNVFDVFSTFYATNVPGFMELNSLAAGFPVWLSVLKFGACFIPTICAYVLEKQERRIIYFYPSRFRQF